MPRIFKLIETEVNAYLTKRVYVSEGYSFSQHDLVKRILIYLNTFYPEGNVDSQGNYKYWFDIISPRIDSEVKNIDFDTKDILLHTDPPSLKDSVPLFLTNAKLRCWLRDTGQGTKLNDAVEDGSAWGNVLWKRTKGGYEQLDLANTYIINQTARTVEETIVIERHELTQSDLRAKRDVWNRLDNLDTVIKECGRKAYSPKKDSIPRGDDEDTQIPYYEIYERNGEISLKDLKEAQGKTAGKNDEDKYVLAKIVVAGLTPNKKKDEGKYVLYAEELTGKMSDVYKEYHRGRYNGRWFRKGIVETLFDIQTRALDLGNQIAQAMEYALKVIFASDKKLTAENVLTDMLNGDIITGNLSQVGINITGMNEAINEWNRLMELADRLCNSYEIIRGENLPSGTPFRLGALQNLNANKLFDFLREKWGLALEAVIGEWVVPDLLKELKSQEVLELAGDKEFMDRYYKAVARAWYIKNLFNIGPHTLQEANVLMEQKVRELKERPMSLVRYERDMFTGFKPKARVVITGENLNLIEKLETLYTFISLEQDINRRNYLLDKAYALKGIDIPPPTPIAPAPTKAIPTSI